MTLNIVIVDDEPLAVERLKGLLSTIDGTEVIATASGCRRGAQIIARMKPDLVLLDVQLQDGSAFDLLSALEMDTPPLIAFSTAFSKYAFKAFEVDAIDYLLKPVDTERLAQVVEKARRKLKLLSSDDRVRELERVVEQLRDANAEDAPRYENELWIRRKGTEHVRVPVASIEKISALDDYVSIFADGQEHLLRSSLDSLEDLLDPAVFARIHRSWIVRTDLVSKVISSRSGGRSALLADGTKLPIGRTHARRLKWQASTISREAGGQA